MTSYYISCNDNVSSAAFGVHFCTKYMEKRSEALNTRKHMELPLLPLKSQNPQIPMSMISERSLHVVVEQTARAISRARVAEVT